MDGKITISKTTSNRNKKEIRIAIEDDASSINFVEARMSLENFAEALTGLGFVDIDFTVRGLENIGKTRERKTVEINLGKTDYDGLKELALSEARKIESDGWVCDGYFSNQDSFRYKDGNTICRAGFVRYV